MTTTPLAGGLIPLPTPCPSLRWFRPLRDGAPFPADTLFALGPAGGYALLPDQGRTVAFGRGSAQPLRVGRGDVRVSRLQGTLHREDGAWTLSNVGAAPLRVSGRREPMLTGHELVLRPEHETVYVTGNRSHVLELALGTGAHSPERDGDDAPTRPRRCTRLTERERLVLTVVYEEYLLALDEPRPTSSADTARRLADLTGDTAWNPHRVANVVDAVRREESARSTVPLRSDEAPPDRLKENLYRWLAVETATLTPRDLDLLEDDDGP